MERRACLTGDRLSTATVTQVLSLYQEEEEMGGKLMCDVDGDSALVACSLLRTAGCYLSA